MKKMFVYAIFGLFLNLKTMDFNLEKFKKENPNVNIEKFLQDNPGIDMNKFFKENFISLDDALKNNKIFTEDEKNIINYLKDNNKNDLLNGFMGLKFKNALDFIKFKLKTEEEIRKIMKFTFFTNYLFFVLGGAFVYIIDFTIKNNNKNKIEKINSKEIQAIKN